MLTNDLHVKSLSSCELPSQSLTLSKGVTAVISVVESDCCASDKIAKKQNNRKIQQCVLLVLLLPVWYQGVITMEEVRVTLTL